MTVHHFYSAKGGQGCTTAMVLEVAATPRDRILVVDATGTGDLWSVLGFNPAYPAEQLCEVDDITFACNWSYGDQPLWRDTDFDHVYIDHGTNGPAGVNPGDERVLVTTSCYIALRRAVNLLAPKPDRIVHHAQPWRALSERDVASALGVHTITPMEHSPRIARSVDAGILYARHRMR